MTDRELLNRLIDCQRAQLSVAAHMLWAMDNFERGEEVMTWTRLIEWCQAKDDAQAAYQRIEHRICQALDIMEGHRS